MRAIASCVLLLAICSASASAKRPGEDVAVEFEVLPSRTHFSPGFAEVTDLVIRNPRQWCRFWRQIHAGSSPLPACDLSLVDFRREVVIASAIGARPNGCFSVGVRSITRARGPRRLQVVLEERVPGPGCICPQAFVWPVTAVVVAKPVGRVEFVHQQARLACDRGLDPARPIAETPAD